MLSGVAANFEGGRGGAGRRVDLDLAELAALEQGFLVSSSAPKGGAPCLLCSSLVMYGSVHACMHLSLCVLHCVVLSNLNGSSLSWAAAVELFLDLIQNEHVYSMMYVFNCWVRVLPACLSWAGNV